MQYRTMGPNKQRLSLFGIGTMRLPLLRPATGPADPGAVDRQKAIHMIRTGIDQGVTYIDTAYPYHRGNSERVVGQALKDGYRKKVNLATKLPGWLVQSRQDCERILDEQLKRLQVDEIDFYLLHALDQARWQTLKGLGVLSFLEDARRAGKIGQIGFSFHDELPVFMGIVDQYAWDFCQIQLNLLDEHHQAGVAGMRYAARRGLGVIVMEPLRGGALAHKVPADVQAIWDQAPIKRSAAEWAFRWLADFPEVSLILSGVSTQEQLEDNVRIFSDARPQALTAQEHALIRRVQNKYREKIQVACTGCNYCMPCPEQVGIPDIFKHINEAFLFDDPTSSRQAYRLLEAQEQDASRCVSCGQCEALCPQHLPIIEALAQAHAYLTKT